MLKFSYAIKNCNFVTDIESNTTLNTLNILNMKKFLLPLAAIIMSAGVNAAQLTPEEAWG